MAGLTFEEICALEPRVKALFEEAQAVKDDGQEKFCRHRVWAGYWHRGIQSRIEETGQGHDVVLQTIYDALPACRNCVCPMADVSLRRRLMHLGQLAMVLVEMDDLLLAEESARLLLRISRRLEELAPGASLHTGHGLFEPQEDRSALLEGISARMTFAEMQKLTDEIAAQIKLSAAEIAATVAGIRAHGVAIQALLESTRKRNLCNG